MSAPSIVKSETLPEIVPTGRVDDGGEDIRTFGQPGGWIDMAVGRAIAESAIPDTAKTAVLDVQVADGRIQAALAARFNGEWSASSWIARSREGKLSGGALVRRSW